jgi:hypothetical protein
MGLLEDLGAWLDQKRRNVASSVQNPGLLYDRMNEDARQFQQDQRANWGDIKSVVPEVKAAGIKEFNASGQELGGLLGTFAGVGAKTADALKLSKAKAMAAKGADPVKVWQETGWTDQFPDGKWRFEISDQMTGYNVNPSVRSVNNKLGDVFSHGRLYSAYPDLKSAEVNLSNIIPNTGLSHKPSSVYPSGRIDVSYKNNDHKGVTLHELQHQIQERENFAKGSSSAMFSMAKSPPVDNINFDVIGPIMQRNNIAGDDLGDDAVSFLSRLMDQVPNKDAEIVVKELRKLRPLSPEEQYFRTAGEAEARLATSRQYLSADERAARPPWLEFDVPREQQIVRGLLGEPTGPAMSVAPTKFQLAHAEAQRNAALPVAQGGLGLGPQNTAMERAKAMGYTQPGYHGTGKDFESFADDAWTSTSPMLANRYAKYKGPDDGGSPTVMPLLVKNGKTLKIGGDANWKVTWPEARQMTGLEFKSASPYADEAVDGILQKDLLWRIINDEGFKSAARGAGKDSVAIGEQGLRTTLSLNPSNIRSRFAAFDPKKRDSRDLLASMGLLGLLGAGAYGQDNGQ